MSVARTLGLTALPLMLLQVAQVLSLDGDIFLASAGLSDHEAGLVAALSLFQRIQFFACFTLASVLLPSVVEAAREGRSVIRATLPVALLYAAVAIPVLGASLAMPETAITLLVGPEFSAAAAGLPMAALAAVAFTLSFLLATLLAALDERRGLVAAALASAIQIALMALALNRPAAGSLDILSIKVALQCSLAAGLVFFTVRHLGKTTCDRPL